MSQLITRREALSHCALFESAQSRILLIQAQAGQGKTILATQYEQFSDIPFAWVTCAGSGETPRSLFDKLLVSLGQSLHGFSPDNVSQALLQQLDPAEFIELATARLGAELRAANKPAMVLFDDAHLLQNSLLAKQFLKRLVEATPEQTRFIVLSRFPLEIENKPLFNARDTMKIDRGLLAFSREEIAMLFNDVLDTPTSAQKVNQLFKATDGWVAGLKLLHTADDIQDLMHADNTAALGTYFDELVLPALTPAEISEAALLALLDEMPKPLVEALASPGLLSWLEDLVGKNCFVRARNESHGRVFRLHHIFQEYLVRDHHGLDGRKRKQFLVSVGNWWLDNNSVPEALSCLAKAEAWMLLADALKLHLLPMLGMNHHPFIHNLLESLPPEVVDDHGWLTFALGAAQFAINPPTAGKTLARATELFSEEKDLFGELLAGCTLLNYQVLTSGEYGGKEELIERTAELYEMLEIQLPEVLRVNCAQAMAVGRAYYQANLRDARAYIERTREDYAACPPGSVPWYRLVEIVVMLFEGDIARALSGFGPLFKLAHSPWVSPAVRFTLFTSYLNSLSMQGMFTAFDLCRSKHVKKWSAMMMRSHMGACITLWEIDKLNSKGRYREAVGLGDSCPYVDRFMGAHIQSQLKGHQSIALAGLGRKGRMFSTLRDALRLRARSGGPFYLHLVHSLAMAALTLVGEHGSAKRIFAKCTRPRENAPHFYHDPLLYSCMTAIHLECGDEPAAADTASTMLRLMRMHRGNHFFGWTPDILKPVLSFAVRAGIDVRYARRLARSQLSHDVLDDGSLAPLLTVRSLGDVRLGREGGRLDASGISHLEADTLRLLANAPHHVMDISALQTALWPNEEPQQSRAKFDTMLSRLRGKLNKAFGSGAGKLHLQLKLQRLFLAHCEVDCDKAVELARKGMELANANDLWLAHTAFEEMTFWLGDSFQEKPNYPTLPKSVAADVNNALKAWITLLADSNALEEALDIVSRALAFDPINDDMQRKRYNILAALKRPTEAAKSLQDYRFHLKLHDFINEEIDHIIDNLLMCNEQA